MIRWVTVQDEGAEVNIFSVSAAARKPSGASAAVTAAAEDQEDYPGIVRLSIAGAVLTEAGEWRIELVVNGEHIEEPIRLLVRAEYERGTRVSR